MIKFRFQKISQVPLKFFKKRKEISEYLKFLKKVLKEKDYSVKESFLILPKEKFSFQNFGDFSLILLCGVGGSSLGAQAIFEALKNKKVLKEILVLDSLNPLLIKRAILKVKKTKEGKTALLFISKSGKTFETTANFFAIFKIIKKYQPKIFIISDRNSPLWNFGQKNKFLTFEIPEKVVGRYSVFSNVGLVPLFLAGVNIKRLLAGAQKANQVCLVDDHLKNLALSSALTIFYHYQKGKNIYSNLVFPPDLEYFGKWYVQLMGESLGKDGKGITPTVTTGTTDFHAIGQLYFDGPRDKLINFVFVENLGLDFEIENLGEFNQIFPGMEKKKIWQLNRAIFEGVKRAYLKKKLPFTETILEKLDEEDLGFLFQMKMIEIILLAKLMKVNAFDQPGVELYKIETRKILKK
jgi:glucose-6-phosphate isomerase